MQSSIVTSGGFFVCFFQKSLNTPFFSTGKCLVFPQLFRISLSERCNFSEAASIAKYDFLKETHWFWNENYFIFLNCINILEKIYNYFFTLVKNAGMAQSEIGLQNYISFEQNVIIFICKNEIYWIFSSREDRDWRTTRHIFKGFWWLIPITTS